MYQTSFAPATPNLLLMKTGQEEKNRLIRQLEERYTWDHISYARILEWVEQFDVEDQWVAIKLLEHVDYYTYPRMMHHLVSLHRRLFLQLEKDGFLPTSEEKLALSSIDFTKTYPSKSGDLVSYFYRQANFLRAVLFKNISDLKEKSKLEERALVILDDYTGTGMQFLLETYAKRRADLFNSYKKVYFVTLVASEYAVDRFSRIERGETLSIAEEYVKIRGERKEESVASIQKELERVASGKLKLVTLGVEKPLLECFYAEERVKVKDFLDKYTIKKYLGGGFSSFGHTVFFYNAPNNLPEILWNTQSVKRDGSPLLPLFNRVEDVSIYDLFNKVPLKEQVW